MLIIGAKGFAKEILEILHQNGETENLCFYDDVSENVPKFLYQKFKVLINESQVKEYFQNTDKRFTLGIGNPILRFKLYEKFVELGGIYSSTISKNAEIGSFGLTILEGCNILSGVKVSNDVEIGLGTMIYYNSIITHDVTIGKFCEISPDVKLLGKCKISDFVQIGAGAIIFPNVKIGHHSIIGAGSIVRNNVPENVMVAGIPAVIKKYF